MCKQEEYEYIVIGAGIAGCSITHFLSKHSKKVLLIDKNEDVGYGASGAAGAFLSPLLGKPNKFKDLVTKALRFSTNFYLENFPEDIVNCGVVRIPKDIEDEKKFESYKPYMDFSYTKEDDGYFFKIGSQVNARKMCRNLSKDVEKLLNFDVYTINKKDEHWLINRKIKGKKLILTTGCDIELIEEEYFKIRAVWGQKIDVLTSTSTKKNYHKACSVSNSKFDEKTQKNILSIGATHHRMDCDVIDCNLCLKGANINKTTSHGYALDRSESDTKELLQKANDIIKLEDVEVIDIKVGARASSLDYFPMLGSLVDSKTTLEKFPHLKNGAHIKNHMISIYDNLYVLNGLGGRGFVLSPYLANNLVEHIINNTEIDDDVLLHRIFKRWVKKSV